MQQLTNLVVDIYISNSQKDDGCSSRNRLVLFHQRFTLHTMCLVEAIFRFWIATNCDAQFMTNPSFNPFSRHKIQSRLDDSVTYFYSKRGDIGNWNQSQRRTQQPSRDHSSCISKGLVESVLSQGKSE